MAIFSLRPLRITSDAKRIEDGSFNEKLENHLHSLYHLDGVRMRGELKSEKSRDLAVLYDRMARLRKVPALAAKKGYCLRVAERHAPIIRGLFSNVTG